MDRSKYQQHIIDSKKSILEALNRLNNLPGSEMTLFVADSKGCVTGTVTDGDIRRALISGYGLDTEVGEITHRSFKWLAEGQTDIMLLRECRQNGIKVLPVLDSKKRLVKVIDLDHCRSMLPVSALLMAGGKGERLRPLTLDTPKPLLKIDGKAIIDYNIDELIACGITDITVCTRYLAEKIEAHFQKPIDGVKVKCVREEQPLGTIGAASLVSRPDEGATIVMNSDLLTSLSFEDLYLRHISENADITVAVIPYQVSVPYAILTTDGPRVTGIEEKPAYSYYANAGIYLINNNLLNKLKRDVRIDATDFIEQSIREGSKVTFFPVNGTWIDIGSPVDFRHAGEIMRHHRYMSDNNKHTNI